MFSLLFVVETCDKVHKSNERVVGLGIWNNYLKENVKSDENWTFTSRKLPWGENPPSSSSFTLTFFPEKVDGALTSYSQMIGIGEENSGIG